MRKLILTALAVPILVASAHSTAVASTIPFTQAMVGQHNPTGTITPDTYFIVNSAAHSQPASAASVADAQSGDWGQAGGMAAANLATGQLNAQAYGTLTGLGVYEYNNIYSQTNALFGDGFQTTAGGSPFVWTSGTQAQFNITVDGALSGSPSVAALGGAWVTLLLYQPGTLDPDHVFGAQPNLITYYHYLLGNPNLQVFSFGQNGSSTLELLPSGYYPLTSGSVSITQNITPGSDFDWVLLLGAYGNAYNPGDTFNLDMSHTVTFSYQGPAGTSTTSASGLFTNYQIPDAAAVPEPASMVLVGTGIVALIARRLQKRSTAN